MKKPFPSEGRAGRTRESNESVRALWEKCYQDHQVRQREQPLVGLEACAFRCAGDEAEVAALRKVVDMLDANAGEGGDFGVRENFLTRLDGYHVSAPWFLPRTLHIPFDAGSSVRDALFSLQ